MTRRQFIELGKTFSGLLLAGASLPTLLFWWRSAAVQDPAVDAWVDLGPAREIPEGKWLSRRLTLERQDRWRREVTEELVYLRRVGRDITVLSSVCPHARCLVQLEGDSFSCPCHRSSFDEEGRVVDGPSPRPLDKLEWRVEKGRLKINYQEFKAGLPRPEVLNR